MDMVDAMTTKATSAVGVDIGGTGIKGGIVDLETGQVVGDRFRIPTPTPSTPQNVAKVVKEIVDQHNGWVRVEGRPNEGACFTVYVPLYTSESEKKKGNRPRFGTN